MAHVVRAILQGIVALLLSKGTEAAQARVAELTAQLRSSRLGGRFATWVEQGWQRLIANPKLQPSQIAPAPRSGAAATSLREASAAPAPAVRRVPVPRALAWQHVRMARYTIVIGRRST